MGGLGRLYSNSAIYALGSIAAKAIGFVMIPVYTRCLTPADYGTIELIYRATDVMTLVAAMGLAPAVMRFYFDYPEQRDRNEVVSSGLVVMFLAGLLLSCAAIALSRNLSILLFHTPENTTVVRLALLSMLLEIMIMVPLSYLQSEGKALFFTGIGIGKLLIGLSMNIWLIVFLKMGVLGVAWSALASGFLSTAFVVPWVVRKTGLRFSCSKSFEMFRYGLPLVPCQLGMFVLSFADRFVLDRFSGVWQVGIYSLGFRFGILVSILVSEPFLNAWLPYALSIADKESYKKVYPDTLRHFTVVATALALVISLFSRDALRVMADRSFHSAYMVVPMIAFGHTVRSLVFQLEIGILVSKKTAYRILSVGTSALFNITLCLVLIPRFGAVGAAWSTAVSCAFWAWISYTISKRLMPVRYDFTRAILTIVTGAGLYAVSLLWQPESLIVSLVFNCLIFLCFPVAVLILGIWSVDEMQGIKGMIRQLRPEEG